MSYKIILRPYYGSCKVNDTIYVTGTNFLDITDKNNPKDIKVSEIDWGKDVVIDSK